MCSHMLGTLPCDRVEDHPGEGRGCTHTSTSSTDDKHTDGGHG